jgi:GNAT superfamily N-acetyltransferase
MGNQESLCCVPKPVVLPKFLRALLREKGCKAVLCRDYPGRALFKLRFDLLKSCDPCLRDHVVLRAGFLCGLDADRFAVHWLSHGLRNVFVWIGRIGWHLGESHGAGQERKTHGSRRHCQTTHRFPLPVELRGHQIGTHMLRMAEEEAMRRGCHGAVLYTISFRAPGFYQRHGWREFGRIPCDPPGTSRVFMTKELRRAGS